MYPQAKSSKSVLSGQEAFRLFTPLESNGDIYEVDTSLKSLVIGPNSDIQNVRVHYYDLTIPGSVQTALVSVDDPYVTRLDAFMATPVENLGTNARILVSSDDLVPHPDQVYQGLSQLYQKGDIIWTYRPHLDILGYHRDPPGFPATRAERKWSINVTIGDRGEGTGASFYSFPGYRRRYFHAKLHRTQTAGAGVVTLLGIAFFPDASGGVFATSTPLGAVAVGGAVGDVVQLVYYADQSVNLAPAAALMNPAGLFDYYMVCVAGPAMDGGADLTWGLNVIATDWA